jgi:hypothetical protein
VENFHNKHCITGKLVGKEDESILPMSLADGPPIVLLLTALVQLHDTFAFPLTITGILPSASSHYT